MSLRAVVDRVVAWVRKVEDAGPDPTFRQRRCPNPDHTATEVIATTHGTVLRHWCSECGSDLITPRGRIYGEGQQQERKPSDGHTNGHTGDSASPHRSGS